MAIDSLRDGFVRLCFDPSGNVVGERCRLVIEGQHISTAECFVEDDVPVRVTSLRDIDCQFGAGSVLAESLKVAFNCCPDGSVDIYALPRNAASGSISAVYGLTVTGTATSDGRLDIYWGEARYNISVRVFEGDTADEIAGAIVAATPSDFPYIVTNDGAGLVTLTAKNAGLVGNNLVVIPNWQGRNNYMPGGVTVEFEQTVDGEGGPEPLDYSTLFGECCICCYAILGENEDWQMGVADYFTAAWSCDQPQCFGHAYTYDSGTLGEVLASDTNSATLSRLAHCTGDPILPWMKTAAYASLSCCETVDHPEISVQGPNFGVLGCVSAPETCAQCFTFDEQEQLRESGFVVTVPQSNGAGELTSPMVTNDITNNRYDEEGKENLTFQSVSSRRLAAQTANELALQLQQFQGLGYFNTNTAINEGVRGTNKRIMLGQIRAWAKSQVGILFSEFENLDTDLTLQDDFEVAPRCLGVPGKLYLNMIYRPPVRIQRIVVNAAPRMMTNC